MRSVAIVAEDQIGAADDKFGKFVIVRIEAGPDALGEGMSSARASITCRMAAKERALG